jgi:hypothetical protein
MGHRVEFGSLILKLIKSTKKMTAKLNGTTTSSRLEKETC